MDPLIGILIAFVSALDFWRLVYPLDKKPAAALKMLPDLTPASLDADVWSLAPSWVTPQFLLPEDGVLHTLSFKSSSRRRSASHKQHAWSTRIPEHSFYQINSRAYVASPEFIFLEAANALNFTQIVTLGCELCGLYAFDNRAERGIRKRSVPLTSKAEIDRYLRSAVGVKGQRKALHALDYVVENSASPMETACALMLFLPYRYGGYGIPAGSLNLEIPLNQRAKRLYRMEKCIADFAWMGQNFVVEYLGLYDHSGESAIESDRARTNALETMGFDVVELTGSIAWDLDAFEEIALRIANIVGKRIERKYLGALPARVELRRQLKRWNTASGRAHMPQSGVSQLGAGLDLPK